MYGGLFDLADEERGRRLEALGWRRVLASPSSPPVWRSPSGDLFVEEEAFRILDRLEGENG